VEGEKSESSFTSHSFLRQLVGMTAMRLENFLIKLLPVSRAKKISFSFSLADMKNLGIAHIEICVCHVA
jgi:hypothetical protein